MGPAFCCSLRQALAGRDPLSDEAFELREERFIDAMAAVKGQHLRLLSAALELLKQFFAGH